MTKKISLSVFLFVIIGKIAMADPSLDIKIPDPLGPLVSIKTVDDNQKTIEERVYDNRGNLLRITVFDDNGAFFEEDEYAYNSNNKKIKHTIKDHAFTGAVTIIYGEKGEKLEVEDSRQGNWVGNKPIEKWTYKYNANGTLIEKKGVFQNGDLFESTMYTYKNNLLFEEKTTKKGKSGQYQILYERDAKGNASKVIYTDFEGKQSKVETFCYDDQGQKIEWVENEYYKGEPRGKTIHIFDVKGNKTQRINVSESGDVWEKRIYKYDNKENLISEDMWDRFGSHAGTIRYTYDDKGNLTEWATYFRGSLDSKLGYKYDYDSYGNWIKKVELNWDFQKNQFEAGSVMSRTIKYRK